MINSLNMELTIGLFTLNEAKIYRTRKDAEKTANDTAWCSKANNLHPGHQNDGFEMPMC